MQILFDTALNPNDYFASKQWNFRRNFHSKRITISSLFKTPKMIGYFSVDENRQFMPDASKLKYLKMPPIPSVHFDLNKGIENFRHKPESVTQEKMDFLLRFILNNIEKLKVKSDPLFPKLLESDIICSRGRLAQIMCANQHNGKQWSLLVSKYKGNIYICQPDGDDLHTLQTKYGFIFEQHLMTEDPLEDPVTDVPVKEAEEFYNVFESQVGNISLLYNAEMDGIDSCVKVDLTKTNFNDLKFVEIKTCSGYTTERRQNRWWMESLQFKWWAQSFLTHVSNVIVGHRTNNGIVYRIDSIDVDTLANSSKNWSPKHSIEFLKEFLSFVQLACRHVDCPHTVYKFDYDPKLSKTIQYAIFEGRNEYSFLPDWYINEINTQKY